MVSEPSGLQQALTLLEFNATQYGSTSTDVISLTPRGGGFASPNQALTSIEPHFRY